MNRIAILTHGGIGGGLFSQGQPAVQQLVERMARHFSIDVFTVQPANPGFTPKGYDIYPCGQWVPRILQWVYLVVLVFRKNVTNRYEIVYAFWGYPAGIFAALLGNILGMPSVIHLQGGDAVSLPYLKYGVFYNPLRAWMCRFAYHRCTRLIALSEFQAACLKSNRVVKEAILIPFGPDTNLFKFRHDRLYGLEIRFLHVGNLTPVKGQEVMLETFSHIVRQRRARLTVVGADFYHGRLKRLCRSLGIESSVEFLGPLPYTSMPAFYQNSDFLLHTPWYEGQGLVFAEASACGAIVAGTGVGMLADMGAECALIVPPGNPKLLADKIITFIDTPGAVEKMQRNARRWVEEKDVNYTERRIVETLNDLIHAGAQTTETPTVKIKR